MNRMKMLFVPFILFILTGIISCKQEEEPELPNLPFSFVKSTYYCVRGQQIELTLQGTKGYVYYQGDLSEEIIIEDPFWRVDENGNPFSESKGTVATPHLENGRIKLDAQNTGISKIKLKALPRGSLTEVAISCKVVVIGVVLKYYNAEFDTNKTFQKNSMYLDRSSSPIKIDNVGTLKPLTAEFLPCGMGKDGVEYNFGDVEYGRTFRKAYFNVPAGTNIEDAVKIQVDEITKEASLAISNDVTLNAPEGATPYINVIVKPKYSESCPEEIKKLATSSIIHFTVKK